MLPSCLVVDSHTVLQYQVTYDLDLHVGLRTQRADKLAGCWYHYY